MRNLIFPYNFEPKQLSTTVVIIINIDKSKEITFFKILPPAIICNVLKFFNGIDIPSVIFLVYNNINQRKLSINFEFCNNLCDFCWHKLVNVVYVLRSTKVKEELFWKTNIPEILKACRKGVNMTQAQFAKTIGIKRSAYAYYESGRTRPKIETLRTIAKVYGLDVNTLISKRRFKFSSPR